MTIQADIRVDEIELTETEGVQTSLVRKYLITNIPTTFSDTRRLTDALTAVGLPVAGDYAPANTNLICLGRQIKMEPNSTTIAVCTLTYMPVAQSKSTFIFSGGTSLSQDTTHVDIFENRLFTSHTFAADDPDPAYASKTFTTGATASVLMPSTTMTATGTLDVDYPDAISRFYVGSTNSTYWASNPPGYWMCTRCDFEAMAVGFGQVHRWQFTFEFQYSVVGWNVGIVYIDPRTNEPPSDLVEGTGYKNIDWYGSVDFNYLFPNT